MGTLAERLPTFARLASWRPGALVHYGRLELRRNRTLYLGWPAVIAGSLPFAAFIARLSGISVHDGMYGIIAVWFALGMPFAALLFGGVAGAGLRGRAEEDDAALAVSPRARALGAAGAALGAWLCCGFLLIALAQLVDHAAFNPFGGGWPAAYSYGAVSLSWGLLVAFSASFVAQSAVVGGAVSAFASVLLVMGIGYVGSTGASVDFLWAPLVASVLGAICSVGAAADLMRRPRRRWLTLAAAVLLPFAAVLASWPVSAWLGPRQYAPHPDLVGPSSAYIRFRSHSPRRVVPKDLRIP